MIVLLHFVDCGQLRLVNDFVQRPLFGTESSVDRKSAGHIRCVVVDLAACIDQQQFTVVELGIILHVVQRAGVTSARHDRAIRCPRSIAPKFPHEFGLYFVLEHARLNDLHGVSMRSHCNLGRPAHRRNFGPALVKPHVVQEVIKGHELLRSVHTPGSPRAQGIYPVGHPQVEVRVKAHRIVDPAAGLHDSRQYVVEVGNRKSIVGTIKFNRSLGAGTAPVPDFAIGITFAAEKQILAVLSARNDRRDGIGFREAGQVIKVTVLAESIFDVPASGAHGCCRKDSDTALADHAR